MTEKNVREKVVALRYKEDDSRAPTVVAKGEGDIARKIKEIARKEGIPIHRDDDLVELLAQIEIDREIPPELYSAIAEILSWIYKANTTLEKEQIST
jgi:flagellar biosynthesis protein